MSLANERGPSEPGEFQVFIRTEGSRCVVCPSGELDLATSDRLRAVLDEALNGDMTRLVLDLSELEFIDSTGIHAIVAASRRAGETGRDFRLVRGRAQVQRTLTVAGLLERLPFD